MATGYDNRGEAGRATFAFAPAAPRQGRGTLAAPAARAGVEGGQTAGGAVMAGPQTDVAQGTGSGIPGFIEELAKPLIEQRQRTKFFEGVAAAQNGMAVAEIEEQRPAWARMFGPGYVEQGAAMYTATKGVLDWEQAQLARMDELKTLSPEELGKDLAATSQALANTGHELTDNLINQQLMERSGPLMALVARERVKHQQEVVTRAQSEAILTGANNYQEQMRRFAELGEPTEQDTQSAALATQGFLGLMVPPAGQTEESYKGMLVDVGLSLMQDGNFYAYEALQGSGALQHLDEEQQRRLEERYDRLAPRRLQEAMAVLGPEMFEYEAKRAAGLVTPMEAANQYMEWNDRLTRETGIRLPAFDVDDMRGEVRHIASDIVRRAERAEDRADAERRHQEDIRAEEEREARQAAQALALVSAGQAGVAKETGMATAADLETAQLRLFRDGDFAALTRNIVANPRSGVSDAVKGEIAGLIGTGVAAPEGFQTESFQRAYQVWQQFGQVPGGRAARAVYFGDADVKMERMHTLMSGGVEGMLAYAQTFGTQTVRPATMSREVRSRAEKAVREFSPNILARTFGGERPLNDSARRILTDIVGRDYQNYMETNPGMSEEDAMHRSISTRLASGEIEIVGGYAWLNPPGERQSLTQLTGLTPREVGDSWNALVESKFEAQGFRPNLDSVSVTRTRGSNGRPLFIVTGFNGSEYEAVRITADEVAQRGRQRVTNSTDLLRRQREWDAANAPRRGLSLQENMRRTQTADYSTRPRR